MKRSKRKGKRPVLTSPWKIGIFVSLLLILMSLGVGYYFVSFYNVDLKWIKAGASGWTVDSNLFMNDMLPLAVAVILVSLVAYLLIASAVHRYRYYLDSGQDYRTMISLAESIDDLTNPAQIARLSQYPELQAVLRSYGDQIREISRDLGTKDAASNYAELAAGIAGLVDTTWGAASASGSEDGETLLASLRAGIEGDRARIAELEKRGEGERRVFAQAALAHGRAVEAISGVGEELLAMTNFPAELMSVAERLNASAAARGADGAPDRALKTSFSEMEASARKLQESGRALQEFSEENNGIAIHLALMAARGSVDEHDLATFAERVRATAERFHKLSGSVSSIAEDLHGGCRAMRERCGMPAEASAPGIAADLSGVIAEIAGRIEETNAGLEKRIMGLGSELHDVHELLQRDTERGGPREKASGAPPSNDSADFEAPRREEADSGEREAAAAADAGDSSDMIIDHGSAWRGMGSGEETPETAESESEADGEEVISFGSMEEMKAGFAQTPPGRDRGADTSDFSNISSLRHLDGGDDAAAETGRAHGKLPEDRGRPDEAGSRWRKVEVEKTEVEEDAGQVNVTVKAAAPKAPPQAADPLTEAADEAPAGAAENDDDPVYDLFDLGAVEYCRENQMQR